MKPVRVAWRAVDRRLLKPDPMNGHKTGQTVTRGSLPWPREPPVSSLLPAGHDVGGRKYERRQSNQDERKALHGVPPPKTPRGRLVAAGEIYHRLVLLSI